MRMRPKLQRNKKQRRKVKHAHGRHARHARTPLEAKLALDSMPRSGERHNDKEIGRAHV